MERIFFGKRREFLYSKEHKPTDDDLDDILNTEIPNLVLSIFNKNKQSGVENFPTYNAVILVDEGQDFLPLWWNILRLLLRQGGEMLLVADATQDVYGTANSWTDEAMIGAGFKGPWVELKRSYRLPPIIVKLVRDFAERFLPPDKIDFARNSTARI